MRAILGIRAAMVDAPMPRGARNWISEAQNKEKRERCDLM